MNTPGIEAKQFSLKFIDEWFRETKPNPIVFLNWYWRWLGFYYKYEMKVLDTPVQRGDSWVYNTELKTRTLYWLGIKLNTIELQ